jgi:hypothetical protein
MQGKRVRGSKPRTRQARVARKRAPKSTAKTDPATRGWKQSWQSYLANNLSVEDVVGAAIQYWEDWFRAAHEPTAPQEVSPPDTLSRFIEFATRCKGDLAYLTKRGANPVITIGLVVLDDVWLPSSMAPVYGRWDAEIRRLSSADFWRRKMVALQRAQEELMEFESLSCFRMSVWYGRIDDSSRRKHPTIRLFEDIAEVMNSIDRGLTRIKRLGLTESNRVLWKNGMFLATRRTKKPSKGKKGGVRRYEWEYCAYKLSRYFETRAGGPQWIRIARLLHFAGLGKFAGALRQGELKQEKERVGQEEIDKVRNRVKKLRRSIGEEAYDFHIASLENQYETRAALREFEGGWTLVERTEVGGKKRN